MHECKWLKVLKLAWVDSAIPTRASLRTFCHLHSCACYYWATRARIQNATENYGILNYRYGEPNIIDAHLFLQHIVHPANISKIDFGHSMVINELVYGVLQLSHFLNGKETSYLTRVHSLFSKLSVKRMSAPSNFTSRCLYTSHGIYKKDLYHSGKCCGTNISNILTNCDTLWVIFKTFPNQHMFSFLSIKCINSA